MQKNIPIPPARARIQMSSDNPNILGDCVISTPSSSVKRKFKVCNNVFMI